MFFKDKLVSHLEDEIKYLREENAKLRNIIISVNNVVPQYESLEKKEYKTPTQLIEEEIIKKPALTHEDDIKKNNALLELKELLS